MSDIKTEIYDMFCDACKNSGNKDKGTEKKVTCINRQEAHMALVDAFHAANNKTMTQDESDNTLYILAVMAGVHADCDSLTHSQLNDLLNYLHEAAENTESAMAAMDKINGEDGGCPECGSPVDTHKNGYDFECPNSGKTECTCTRCDWSSVS